MLAFGPGAGDGRGAAIEVLGDVSTIIEELAERLRDKPRADWDVAELDRVRRDGAARSGATASPRAPYGSRVRRPPPARSRRSTRARTTPGVATLWHATPRENS